MDSARIDAQYDGSVDIQSVTPPDGPVDVNIYNPFAGGHANFLAAEQLNQTCGVSSSYAPTLSVTAMPHASIGEMRTSNPCQPNATTPWLSVPYVLYMPTHHRRQVYSAYEQAIQPDLLIVPLGYPQYAHPTHNPTPNSVVKITAAQRRRERIRAILCHIHTEDTKHHICKDCGGKFRRRWDALRHWKSIHGGERPVCPKCNKTISRKDALKKHASSCNRSSADATF